MNNGDDTDYYLRKGYKVTAVEANPSLCAAASERFSKEITGGSLTIVNAAIWSSNGEKTFFINLDNDHWSSLDLGWAGRDDSTYKKITVQSITVNELFTKFGVPLYIKIDIEGVDDLVLSQLKNEESLPQYLSIEDCRFGYEYMSAMNELGYDGYKLVDQSNVPDSVDQATGYRFNQGSSGPFGEDLTGEWIAHDQMENRYSNEVRDRQNNRKAPRTHWWDIHCRAPLSN